MSRKNYTEREKRELLAIVSKYKSIIENKSTNAVSLEKKNETWNKIANEYNSAAENPRTARQLNTAYQNLKRLTRQKTSDKNNQNYISKKEEILLKKLKKDEAEDKKAIMATGGGSYTPLLTDVGAQMLAIMGDQLIPLSNDCDSAAEYFLENDSQVIEIVQDSDIHEQEHLDEHDGEESSAPTKVQEKKQNSSLTRSQNKNRQHIHLKHKKRVESTTSIKRKFYQKKLECALIEKKN